MAAHTFLRAETVPSPQLREEPRFLEPGRTKLGRGAAGDELYRRQAHTYLDWQGCVNLLSDTRESLQENWGKLESGRSFSTAV